MTAISICSLPRWENLCENLGLEADHKTYTALINAHAEKHRAYHTLDHIAACLKHLDNVRDQLTHADEVEMALWFHDAIYKPFSSTNEDDSADMARNFLTENNVSADVTARIYDLIILTKDHGRPTSIDGQFMLDIDLSILGTASHIYAQFEADVRQEYKRVPRFIFRKKRKEILQGFLSRPKIYQTDYFYERLEAQARTNLSWAIANI